MIIIKLYLIFKNYKAPSSVWILSDVHYSNSIIEAFNKILKYNYLYKMDIKDKVQLEKMIKWIIEDYNNRPHVSLDGLSPNEKYLNPKPDKITRSQNVQNATIQRKIC